MGKYSKRRRSNVAGIVVQVIFISSFLFYCLLLNHSFQTNPNRITNCFKTYSLLFTTLQTTFAQCFPAILIFETDGEDGRYALEEILNTFVQDLIQHGHVSKDTTLENISRLDLAMKIMKTYIKYPLPASPVIPWNYCAASKLYPWLKAPLSLIC